MTIEFWERLDGLSSEPILVDPSPLENWQGLTPGRPGRILGKRDDVGLFALGGNKLRKLAFELPRIRESGADVLVTTGGVQSNHARLTAALAARLGLECRLYLKGVRPQQPLGNVLVDLLCGAEIVFVDPEGPVDLEAAADAGMERLRAAGRRPYRIPLGGASGLGTLAYAQGFREFERQARELGVEEGRIVLAAGTGSTAAGLALGAACSGRRFSVHAISVSRSVEVLSEDIRSCQRQALSELGLDPNRLPEQDLLVRDDRIGAGYTIPTPEGRQAVRRFASELGVLSDLTYTGKAAGVFLEDIDVEQSAEHTIFWHTGGSPEIFSRDVRDFGLTGWDSASPDLEDRRGVPGAADARGAS